MNFDAMMSAGVVTLSLSGIAAALITFGEFRENKKNVLAHLNSIREQRRNDLAAIKDELEAHEKRDDNRHKEVLDRIEKSEEHIIEIFQTKK